MEKKTPDLALHLRTDFCSGTVFALGASGGAGAPLLPAGADHAARLLTATAKSDGGFRSGSFVPGGDQKSARTLRSGDPAEGRAPTHSGACQSHQRGAT